MKDNGTVEQEVSGNLTCARRYYNWHSFIPKLALEAQTFIEESVAEKMKERGKGGEVSVFFRCGLLQTGLLQTGTRT